MISQIQNIRSRPVSLVKTLLATWLLASLLFAHGCHGDEDAEMSLSGSLWNVVSKTVGFDKPEQFSSDF
jgi:hypothetical protein